MHMFLLVVLAICWTLVVSYIAEENYWSPVATWVTILGGALLIGLLL